MRYRYEVLVAGRKKCRESGSHLKARDEHASRSPCQHDLHDHASISCASHPHPGQVSRCATTSMIACRGLQRMQAQSPTRVGRSRRGRSLRDGRELVGVWVGLGVEREARATASL